MADYEVIHLGPEINLGTKMVLSNLVHTFCLTCHNVFDFIF